MSETGIPSLRSPAASKLGARVLAEWGVTALLTLALVLWLSLAQVTQRGDNVVFDTLIGIQPVAPHPDIAIIAIDDRSLEALGPWPWPRDRHAALIDRLSDIGVRSVAYDVLFVEPTPQDDTLSRALTHAGNIYLPAAIDTPGLDGRLASVALPASGLDRSAAGVGHAVLTPDQDGTVRNLPLWASADGKAFSHLAVLAATDGDLDPPIDAGDEGDGLHTAGVRTLRYPAGAEPFPTVSFIDVLRGEVEPRFLQNKRVLVGATAQGMGDRYATPTSPDGSLTPGVYVVGALMQSVLDDWFIRPTKPWTTALFSLLPLAVMLAGFLWLRPVANTVLGLGLIAVTVAASAILLRQGIWFPPLAACAGVIVAWPLWSWRRLAATYRYMQAELNDLRADTETHHLSALSPGAKWQTGDEISRQVLALSATLKQFRDFNRYITQSVRSLPDAAVVSDVYGKVLIANPRAQQLFSDTLLEGALLDDLFLQLGHRDWRSLIGAAPGARDELQLPDGRALQIAVAPLVDTAEQSAGLIVRMADVTQLRAAERERQRTLQLLGHDMRAPQVSILTLLSNPDRSPKVEAQIRRNAEQTLSLAEGYVQLSRAENQMLTFVIANLADLVTEAADTLWPQSAAKGVELVAPDDGHDYLVDVDIALMRRVVINLLDNAIRHTPTGGHVACRLSNHEGKVLLIICDEGPGLDEDMRSRLFQPFAGGNVSGAGLGLAFVHTVIQRHGGQITVEAPAGITPPTSGACFYITLPQVEGEPD